MARGPPGGYTTVPAMPMGKKYPENAMQIWSHAEHRFGW